MAWWEGAAAEDQEEVLGRAVQWLAGTVDPVEIGRLELDAGEVDRGCAGGGAELAVGELPEKSVWVQGPMMTR